MKTKLMYIFLVITSIIISSLSIYLENYELAVYGLLPILLMFFVKFKTLTVNKSEIFSTISFVLVHLVFIGLFVLSTKQALRFNIDITKNAENTVSDQALSIIQYINSKNLKVNFKIYASNYEKRNELSSFVTLYTTHIKKTDVFSTSPLESPIEAKKDQITRDETLVIEIGSNSKKLEHVSEKSITKALIALVNWKKKSIAFSIGHGEGLITDSSSKGFSLLAKELISERYDVSNVDLINIKEYPDLLIVNNQGMNLEKLT